MFTSLKGGMSELVDALVNQLTGDLRPSHRATGLKYLNPGFEVTFDRPDTPPLTTDAVVLAIPAYVAAGLLKQINPNLANMLKQVRYVSTGTVSLGYRRAEVQWQHDFNGFGFMIPKSEKRQILACTWSSTKFNYRASDDHVLARVFVGGDGKGHLVDLPDDRLIALVESEIADIMGVTVKPITRQIFRWPRGNPQYDVGHLDRVTEMEKQAAATPGLYLTGSAFRGIGIPDCVKSAISTVDRILTQLG